MGNTLTRGKLRDEELSNIAAGYIVNSPSEAVVHVDVVYEGNLASSVFNYANVTEEGLVDNTVTTYSDNSTDPEIWRDFVQPNFPIFPEDILVESEAVFGGLVERKFLRGQVASVSSPFLSLSCPCARVISTLIFSLGTTY